MIVADTKIYYSNTRNISLKINQTKKLEIVSIRDIIFRVLTMSASVVVRRVGKFDQINSRSYFPLSANGNRIGYVFLATYTNTSTYTNCRGLQI